MGYEYDVAIEVDPQGDGEYAAAIEAGWVVGGGVNGGYLLGVIGNAIRSQLGGHPDPYSISAYYLSATVPGPATIRAEALRRGKGTPTARATLNQVVHGRHVHPAPALATLRQP